MSHALADDEGLVCAFELAPRVQRRAEGLRDHPGEAPVWLHLNLNDARARRWVHDRAGLPPEAREVLISPETRIHVELLGDGLVAVLGDLEHDFHGRAAGFHHLRLYLDDRRLVTGRRHPLKSADDVRRGLQGGGLEGSSPLAVFERLIEALAGTLGEAVARLGDEVDDAEELVLAGQVQRQGTVLGRIRRSLAQMRRHMNANRAALAPVPARLPARYTTEQRQDLRQAIDRLDAVGQDLELVQERARLLQEEIAGRLTEATNRNLFVLSIVTTILLPATLITGVFGMNVGGLPWVGRPGGFWWVMAVMLGALVATLLFLRRKRVL